MCQKSGRLSEVTALSESFSFASFGAHSFLNERRACSMLDLSRLVFVDLDIKESILSLHRNKPNTSKYPDNNMWNCVFHPCIADPDCLPCLS